MPTPRTSRKAVASLVLIALCLLLPATPVAALAFPVGVTGLVLGFIGLGDIRRSEGRLQGRMAGRETGAPRLGASDWGRGVCHAIVSFGCGIGARARPVFGAAGETTRRAI